MTRDAFIPLVGQARIRTPIWFELESDRPSSEAELDQLSAQLGVALPSEYREFLKTYGGGYFALANVFSAQEGSPWNVVDQNRRNGFSNSEFLAISSNGTGDLYGFAVKHGVACNEIVFRGHEDGFVTQSIEYEDLYEYLAQYALSTAQRDD